jgi:hypothetical protein
MSAVTYNSVIDQGADWFLNVTWENVNNEPIDITGYTAALQLRTSPLSRTVALNLTTENDGLVLNGVSGLINIHATNEQTALLAPQRYSYDLELYSPDSPSIVTRLIQGIIDVSANTTRE